MLSFKSFILYMYIFLLFIFSFLYSGVKCEKVSGQWCECLFVRRKEGLMIFPSQVKKTVKYWNYLVSVIPDQYCHSKINHEVMVFFCRSSFRYPSEQIQLNLKIKKEKRKRVLLVSAEGKRIGHHFKKCCSDLALHPFLQKK